MEISMRKTTAAALALTSFAMTIAGLVWDPAEADELHAKSV